MEDGTVAHRPARGGRILVTGAAGFIGMHVAQALLREGAEVVGLDNLDDYYDVRLKEARLAELAREPRFRFERLDIADAAALARCMASQRIDRVVHLAAQAGVRHSVSHPQAYGRANLVGFLNVLEACRSQRVVHLVYASSSSVYGGNRKMPFAEHDAVDHPLSLYAATKKANELMAHSYSHLYDLPTTGLRFFTVYGPWGRPDMACWRFAQAIVDGEAIPVFNRGEMSRDFTYIDDIVDGVLAVLARPPARQARASEADGPAASNAPYRVLNIGSHAPVPLLEFIGTLERALRARARLDPQPMQPGDVAATCADVRRLEALAGGRRCATPLAVGIARFVDWFCAYRGIDLDRSSRRMAVRAAAA